MSKNIVNNTSTDTDDYISGFEYRLNGTYVIRNSYLTSDNKTTVCSASKTVGDVNFVFPYVSQVRGTTKGEGVNPRENNTDSQFRAVFTQTPLQYIGKVVLPGGTVEFWTNDNVTCLAIGRTTFVCGAMVGARFVLANTNGFDPDLILWSSSRPLTNVTVAEIVSASGEPINGMKSSERRIRLLASLIGSRVLSTYRFGDKPSQRLITKDTLERISFMIMSVANEEGIGGMREEKGFRSIKKAEKQSATMKRMAYIPIGILLFSAVALAAVDRLISLLITLKLRNDGFKRASTREVHERTRVQMSMQWFSERVCDDLRASTIFQDVSLSDVSAKHVVDGGEQWFQVLPLRSGQHQYGNAP